MWWHWEVQAAANSLADRAGALVDLNERALALRTGGVREPDDDRETGHGGRGGFCEDRGNYSRRYIPMLQTGISLYLPVFTGQCQCT